MSDKSNLSKTYMPSEVEEKIYKLWLAKKAFHAVPDDRGTESRYVVMMPLPNVTGALHMGHAMDNVMQDLLIRWHRMMGDNTLWMPGTDHAGIATQAVVEKRLKELENITRHDLGREGLVKRIWEWKDHYQARIIEQQQRMGCSCDWERQRFTMDNVCARAVRHAFFRMFRDGLIFRGKRLVNWDVFLRTTISDDEMYYETVDGFFWNLVYPVIDPQDGEPESLVVATTRPETMLGDTAVAVHPDPEGALNHKIKELEKEISHSGSSTKKDLEDELAALQQRKASILPRLLQLRDMAKAGRMVNLPLLDRPIPIIMDEWAKPELGSGCVKITPAHDYNDYDVWMRHKESIDIINILNEDGTLNEAAGPYAGMDRFAARDKVVKDLDNLGLLGAIEDRIIEIGHSDRSKTPIEPFLSDQWFIKMGDVDEGVLMGRGTDKEFKSPGLVQAAMDAVNDGRVKIHPERYKKTYLDWLSEKRDWPISRQLWWGHRIPVWSMTYEKGRLKDETLFTALADICRNNPPLQEEVFIRINTIETEKQVFITGEALSGIMLPGWAEEEECRVDICLLQDRSEFIKAFADHGYEQDPNVLDTWFSSALWPFSTLGWPDPATAAVDEGQASLGPGDGAENCCGAEDCCDYYYPGSCLVTARDIITLWVARMVLAGLYCLGDIPFTDVFIHANILDGKGVRMSKSKGNGIDPVDIINNYGADAMRYVLCDMQTGTQDIRLPVTAICPECEHHNDLGKTKHGRNIFCYVCNKCNKEFDVLGTLPNLKQAQLTSERFDIGRAFCTKLWNSARFAFMNMENVVYKERTKDDLAFEDIWIMNQLNITIGEVDKGLRQYNPSYAINAIRDFFWSSFCDWYLELVKPRLNGSDNTSAEIAQQVLALCLDQIFRLLHPFIPYITEHLWQALNSYAPKRGLGDLAPLEVSEQLIIAPWPHIFSGCSDPDVLQNFPVLQEITRAIREIRAERNIPPKQKCMVTINPSRDVKDLITTGAYVIRELGGLSDLTVTPGAKRVPGSAYKLVSACQIFVHDVINDDEERNRLQEALAQVEKEITICEKKLGNESFVQRAPEQVVQKQRDRLEEYKANKERILTSIKELDG